MPPSEEYLRLREAAERSDAYFQKLKRMQVDISNEKEREYPGHRAGLCICVDPVSEL